MPQQIDELRKTAARFFKVDLHLHSPLSFDWKNDSRDGKTPNPLLNRISSPNDITEEHLEAYYQILEASSLNVVAITDHMKWTFGFKLADYVKRKNKPILVLPGIELNTKISQPLLNDYRIHTIAFFPPDIGQGKIETIFPPSFPDEYKRNAQTDEISCNDIQELIQKIHDLNGCAIAAHIYSSNGIRLAYTKKAELILQPIEATEPKERLEMYKRFGDSIKGELLKFDCLQVMETTDQAHFINNDTGELRIPIIYASDSHHISQIGNPSKITYIKMGLLTIDSLYEAFHYPDTRIRFIKNLPTTKPPRIKGIRIVGKDSEEKSFFKNIAHGFSDNLSCIIGPRGCGKSAIIDSIRYSMGYNRTLGEIEKVKDQVIDRQKNTLQESRIEILYEKADGVTHKVLATYDEKEDYVSVVQDLEGNVLSIIDVEGSGEYPLNLYGWNELELLGENPKSQRDNLDRFIKDLPQLKQERTNQYSLLQDNYNACYSQLETLEGYFDPALQKTSFTRLKEFEKEYEKLNTPEIGATLKLLDSINQRLSFIDKLKLQIETSNAQLNNIPLVEIDTLLEKHKSEKEWCTDELLKRLNIKEYNDLAIKYRTELAGRLQGYLQILNDSRASLEKELTAASKDIKEKVGDNVSISADLRNNAKKRFDFATEQFELYNNELGHLDDLILERQEIINKIKSLNDLIYATRNREISNITSKIQLVEDANFRISLKLEQENDRSDLLEYIQSNNHNLVMPGQCEQ